MTTRRLLVPLDGSVFSRQILPHLQRLFSPESCTVQLLHVALPPMPADALAYPVFVGSNYTFYTYQDAEEGTERHPIYDSEELESFRHMLEDELKEEAALFQGAGYQVSLSIHFGSPAQEIVAVARSTDTDLVAMMTHGRQGLNRLFSGSVAEEVVRHLSIPVMVVNGKEGSNTGSSAAAEPDAAA